MFPTSFTNISLNFSGDLIKFGFILATEFYKLEYLYLNMMSVVSVVNSAATILSKTCDNVGSALNVRHHTE